MPDCHTGPEAATFSLLGGPLHRMGRWLGLVRGTDTVHLGLVLGIGMWLVVVGFAALQGFTDRLFTLSLVAVHARLLLVIPLVFPRRVLGVASDDRLLSRRSSRRGIVPPGAKAALDAEVARTRRCVDAWWPEAMCLLAAGGPWVSWLRVAERRQNPRRRHLRAQRWPASCVLWPRLDAVPILALSLGLELGLWTWFPWRVSRLDLMLIPGTRIVPAAWGCLKPCTRGSFRW